MIGETVSHYEIVEKIGEGGMGVVYKARDTKLNRLVALKFLPKQFTSDRDARTRFLREARAAAALNNPNIVTIHEINYHEDLIYIVMEYVEGHTLKEFREHTDFGETQKIDTGAAASPFPPAESINIEETVDTAVQICHGLKAAHDLGIVHRDIKPQNIIINREKVAKILDFGVAKLTTQVTNVTDKYSTMGTVYYMSPDQFSGKPVDQRADIWSFGVVLYEMLTAQLPFQGDHYQEVIHTIINNDPIPPRELNVNIPGKLEHIILKCLRKDRDNRCQSTEELLKDFKKLKEQFRKASSEFKVGKKKKVRKGAERRQATVISAEIYGYNEMMEQLDTEDAAAILNNCSEMFTAVVKKHGGWVDKIMGGGFISFFGVPSAIENAPKAAVIAAIEMRGGLYRFNRENKLEIPLDISFGINTGMVIAGVIGTNDTKDYTVMGDTVVLASRLKEVTPKGQVFAGPATHRYTRDFFAYKSLKPVTIKGQAKPVAVFELLSTGEKTVRPVSIAERMIQSEMVGREKESDRLRLYLLKVINGEGSVISVVGEAGIGKSRLIAEFKKSEDFKKVTLLEGRALAIGKNLSYHPIIDILKNWLRIEDDAGEKTSFAKLEAAVTAIYPEGAAEILPFIATMMGLKLTGNYADRMQGIEGEALEKLILKNCRDFIAKASERRIIVCIIEDLHWADASTIELLEVLFKLVENHRILIVNTLRPNYKETGERILDTLKEHYRAFHSEIRLEPLNEKQCDTLIHNLMKVSGLPKETKETITGRAEGNPFFIEEVLRSFIDEGIIELENGGFAITGKIDAAVIPETIQDVLMVRIDRLDEAVKNLLKEASVIGRHFFHKILIKVARDTEGIDDNLEYLKDIQLIMERKRFGEVEYLFKNALVQEVAYESILLKTRKELHLKVAEAIESIFPERLHEFYGMLALHYSKAENEEKAEEYLTKAGEEALKAAASNEALTYYREALKLYLNKYADEADHEKIASLERKIALAYYNKGNYLEAEKHFGRVLDYWGVKRPKSGSIIGVNFLFDLLIMLRNLYLPSRKAKLTPTGRDNDIIEVSYLRGTTLASININRMVMDSLRILNTLHKFDLGKVRDGINIYASASALFSYAGISFPIARKILDYARQYIEPGDRKKRFKYDAWQLMYDYSSGDWDIETCCDEEMVEVFLQAGDFFTAANPLFFAALIVLEQGHFDTAAKYFNKIYEIGEVYENDYARDAYHLINVRFLLKTGKLDEAAVAAEAGVSFAKRIGKNASLLFHIGVKANVLILRGDAAGAEEMLRQGDVIASRERLLAPMHIISYHFSRFLLDIYNLEKNLRSGQKKECGKLRKKAGRSGKEALKTSKKHAPYRVEAKRLTGTFHWLMGKQKKALYWWEKGIKDAEQLGDRVELARTYREMGRRMLESNSTFPRYRGRDAADYLKEARVIFTEMALDWDLKELALAGSSLQ